MQPTPAVKNGGDGRLHFVYDSFGKLTSGSTTATRYLYTGREYDPATGLQYNRFRYYDAAVGRFINEDPIGFRGGDANLNRYAGNGPTNATDPFGLFNMDANGAADVDPSVDPAPGVDDPAPGTTTTTPGGSNGAGGPKPGNGNPGNPKPADTEPDEESDTPAQAEPRPLPAFACDQGDERHAALASWAKKLKLSPAQARWSLVTTACGSGTPSIS